MAFPIPTHLPRKDARDVSTQVLSKISETPYKSLNAALASSWVQELSDTIKSTKHQIHERIASDLPNFEKQLATSISVQERLSTLSSNVNALDESISAPETGLVPNLIHNLTGHAAIAQDASDARSQHNALSHLLKCRNELRRLTRLVEKAELADATRTCASLKEMMAGAPEPLLQSEVMTDMKRRCSALQNHTEEQIQDAYSRSVVISESELSIKPSVEAVLPRVLHNGVWVQSHVQHNVVDTVVGLSDLFASMSPPTLSMHLSTLRRDITSHCIEYVLKQPVQIYQTTPSDMNGVLEHKLSFQRSPPDTRDLTSRLSNLTTSMEFLNATLFPHLPSSERKSFPLSLCTPIRTAILNYLLLPNLPTSLSALPDFLSLSRQAVQLEDDIIIRMLGDSGAERGIKSWVESVGLHYERGRRAEILNKARAIATSANDDAKSFRVEVPLVIEEKVIPVQVEDEPVIHNGGANGVSTYDDSKLSATAGEDAWGFEEDAPSNTDESPTDDWGFDDDATPEPTPEVSAPVPEPEPVPDPPKPEVEPEEEDPGDAWGWNDDAEPTEAEDESVWDDPWNDKPAAPAPVPPSPAPKQAKGLEKRFAGKSVPNSPIVSQPPAIPAPTRPLPPTMPAQPQNPTRAPPPVLKPVQVTESYAVSGRTKELLQLVDDILREGAELVASGILSATASGAPGHVLMQAAPMALELFRALVPVAHAVPLKQSAKEPMRFSNDCLYVRQELRRVVAGLTGPKAEARDKLEEGLERLKVLSESWFDDTIAREEKLADEVLDSAQGFIDTNQQDRFDECESAVNDVLKRIKRIAPQWKAVLAKSRYYEALGSVVDSALSRILGDVLALEDITEAESHRLCELCHILNALEGLFVEDPDQPSFVVSYVPSWLKFSYLSELLEASIADISYLFEEGALVDFEIEELVKLVKALFADTPLRANTVNKLLQGHPIRDS